MPQPPFPQGQSPRTQTLENGKIFSSTSKHIKRNDAKKNNCNSLAAHLATM